MARLWGRLGALPSGLFAGAFFGALIGGIGGRIIMRIVFLIDKDTRGAEAAGGTIGEFTLGGSFSLFVVCMIGGVLGGALYVGLRRWLPWSGLARGVFFGLLLMFTLRFAQNGLLDPIIDRLFLRPGRLEAAAKRRHDLQRNHGRR